MSERAIDYFTAPGAAALAARVRGYWISRGHDVAVRIVELPRCEKRNGRAWTIATDGLVAGLPVGAMTPSVTPANIVRRELACGKSPVQIERILLRAYPDLSRGELRAAFQEAGAPDGR